MEWAFNRVILLSWQANCHTLVKRFQLPILWSLCSVIDRLYDAIESVIVLVSLMRILDTSAPVLAIDARIMTELKSVVSGFIPVSRLGLEVVIVVLSMVLWTILFCSSIFIHRLRVELRQSLLYLWDT